ncbi:MAG TPA: T9SS type A sorting domain-containing protein, partial [bacterium]|nr:T9SS type A sorting domain-containing protein [bacterium]
DAFGSNVTPPLTIVFEQAPALSLDGVFPNPSTGPLSAHVRIPEAGEVRLEALDVAGRVVASQTAWRQAGVHELPISRGLSFAPGVYVVRLHYRGSIKQTTAIVLR